MTFHSLKIISGGQTGVDRAALDYALNYKIQCGGWCPKGRQAEDGEIHIRYPLIETLTDKYAERTERNIEHSDGTLILTAEDCFDPGTILTRKLCKQYMKPCLIIDIGQPLQIPYEKIRSWIRESKIHILNIAGPRESTKPGIYEKSLQFLEKIDNQ